MALLYIRMTTEFCCTTEHIMTDFGYIVKDNINILDDVKRLDNVYKKMDETTKIKYCKIFYELCKIYDNNKKNFK